jgi:uncharacterized protein (DUF305 family)
MLTSNGSDDVARIHPAPRVQWRTVMVIIASIAAAACGDDGVDRARTHDAGLNATRGSGSNNGPGVIRGSDGGADRSSSESDLDIGDRRMPFTPANDREFVDFFVAHHEMAIMMADHERTHGENGEVKNVAQRVIDSQQPEVDKMRAIAAELTDPPPAAMPHDPHADADMDRMSNIAGPELDAMFLTEMIAHHAAGLPVAHRALKNLKRDDLRALATNMQQMQGLEIGEMQGLREKLSVTGAGEDLAPGGGDRADMGMVGDMRISLTPANDVEFVDFFVPHHQMAIDMAELVIARGQDPEVRAMAEQMHDTQAMEIERMRSVRASLAGTADSPAVPDDMHMQSDMAMMRSLSGTAVDALFLGDMAQHHAAGIPTAHRAKPHVENAELRSMSDSIFQTQAREIGQMQQMLEKLSTP